MTDNEDRVAMDMEKVCAWVAANLDRIDEQLRIALRDENGKTATPFVLLLPATTGTQLLTNLPGDTALHMMRDTVRALQFQRMAEALAPMVPTILAAIVAARPDDEDDDKPEDGKVH